MSFDPITLALAKNYTDEKVGSGGGLPVFTLKDTQPIPGEQVYLGDVDTEAANQLAEAAVYSGNFLPIVLVAGMGGTMAVVCNPILNSDGGSNTLTYVGNITIGGVQLSIQFFASQPVGDPSIYVEILE